MLELEKMNEINEYIQEYLSYYKMNSTLEHFKKEIQTKMMAKRLRNDKDLFSREEPRMHQLFSDVS